RRPRSSPGARSKIPSIEHIPGHSFGQKKGPHFAVQARGSMSGYDSLIAGLREAGVVIAIAGVESAHGSDPAPWGRRVATGLNKSTRAAAGTGHGSAKLRGGDWHEA